MHAIFDPATAVRPFSVTTQHGKPRRFYLAGRYQRRAEIAAYRDALVATGAAVTCRWLDGLHTMARQDTAAREDFEDVAKAQELVLFTESHDPEPPKPNTGGRLVEFGIALGMGKTIHIIGPNECVFTHLTYHNLHHYDCWDDFLATIARKPTTAVAS